MPRSDRNWPTRRGRHKPLDVLAAQEELSQELRKRCFDAIEAEAVQPPSGADATKHISAYSKALDGLIKLQFDLGHLERVGQGHWNSRGAVPSERHWAEFSPAEKQRMGYAWITSDMTPALESTPKAARDPNGDDA
jgi:hypothetical protein